MKAVAIPKRLAKRPRDAAGRLVPWFVAWLDDQGRAVPDGRGGGKPDFRVIRPDGIVRAYRESLCWLCGQHLSAKKTFVIGPMCCVNRISAEPGSHLECAAYACMVCPFLLKPGMERNTNKAMPEGARNPAGIMIERNPGVTALWTTRRFGLMRAGNGYLFRLGPPEGLEFWAEGKPANSAQIAESIRTGLPILRKVAADEGPEALAQLEIQVAEALLLARLTRADIGEAA